ncbi:HAD family phosphatase [Microbacterium sp. ET2]|uniref:HAD family hydrolase n=1 Tax=Microbacterium albipurpureum TaxID=3050384 RepID=UPI00259C8813|nr:HAD family phosphatase [Microbacterium sp. ET2 (Ac-2212)]WJL96746.1 HAD family phosphatase [Microbacterium sp. ET2 (Ac-2212)]
MTTRLRAVLFDLDGTIADTEPLWVRAKEEIARRHAIVWTREDSERAIGQPTPVYAGEFVRRGARGSTAQIASEITAHVAEGMAEGIAWRPGALVLLTALVNAGIPTALVTMAYRPVAEALAAATGLGVFDVIVAGDDVEKSKPDPEPYERALAALGVPARGCVAIEDTETGARSAEAAGLRTLVVPSVHDMAESPRPVGRTLRPTLEGLMPAELAALL